MLRLTVLLAVLLSFVIHPNNGSCPDPDGTGTRCSQSSIAGGASLDPNGSGALVETDKGLGVDPNG